MQLACVGVSQRWQCGFTALVFLVRSSVDESTESPGDHWGKLAKAVRKLATQGEWRNPPYYPTINTYIYTTHTRTLMDSVARHIKLGETMFH